MKKLDTYLNLCTETYDLSKPTPPEDAYAFYRSYVSNTKGPILEPMCGTGRFLLPLLEEHFNVRGFDASEHMLNVLHVKAKSMGLKPNVWRGFVEELDQPKEYGLIFIPSGSFGLISDLDAAKLALKTFYDHLLNDGILVFEVGTLKSASNQMGVWRGAAYQRKDGKMIIANFLNLSLEENIETSIIKYELINGNHIVQTEIETYKLRLYEPQNLVTMIKNVGFREVRVVKAFVREQTPNETDEVVVYECRK